MYKASKYITQLQNYPHKKRHLFLWGSSGTGKTLLLIECLRIMMAISKLKSPKMKTEVIVLVYHENIKDTSQIIKDLKEKYLPSITSGTNIKPKTFIQFCNGTLEFYICYSISYNF